MSSLLRPLTQRQPWQCQLAPGLAPRAVPAGSLLTGRQCHPCKCWSRAKPGHSADKTRTPCKRLKAPNVPSCHPGDRASFPGTSASPGFSHLLEKLPETQLQSNPTFHPDSAPQEESPASSNRTRNHSHEPEGAKMPHLMPFEGDGSGSPCCMNALVTAFKGHGSRWSLNT